VANERQTTLRVVGYIREASADGEPAFAQSEKIRRWINENGHRLVALCQDVRTPGHAVGREGLQSIVGIVSAGQVDAVVVPSLTTLSPDKVSQEAIMWDLREHGVTVLSTEQADIPQLSDPPSDNIRLMVRDVLAKAARFHKILSLPVADDEDSDVIRIDDTPDVVIELIPPNRAEALPTGQVRPAP
jgi:DNA invertase Pin-like site-specific DNA recombinase